MDAKSLYTQEDCISNWQEDSLKGTVVVLDKQALPEGCHNQLYYCMGEDGTDSGPRGRSLMLKSLSVPVYSKGIREDIVGILKPELLPDSARLQLAQLRPDRALDLTQHKPEYSGYSFLTDGRYAPGVWLCNEQEVMEYVEMQKLYQYRIMICDRNDFCVFEMQEQRMIYPDEQAAARFLEQGHLDEQSMI